MLDDRSPLRNGERRLCAIPLAPWSELVGVVVVRRSLLFLRLHDSHSPLLAIASPAEKAFHQSRGLNMASCYKCGSHVFFEHSLCRSCESKENEAQTALKRTADAAEATSFAAADAAAAQEAMLEKLEEREARRAESARRKQRMKFVKAFVECPAALSEALDDASDSIGDLHKALAELSDKWNISLARWLELRAHQPHSFDLAYQDVRASVVPAILRVWRERNTISPSPEEPLRSLAATFIYPDLKAASAILDSFEQAKKTLRPKWNQVGTAERDARVQKEKQDELFGMGFLSIVAAFASCVVLCFFCSWTTWIMVVVVAAGAARFAYRHFDELAVQHGTEAESLRNKAASLQKEVEKEAEDQKKSAEAALARLRDPTLIAIAGPSGRVSHFGGG